MTAGTPQLALHSIHFAFPGNAGAIDMIAPMTWVDLKAATTVNQKKWQRPPVDHLLGKTPEWIAGLRSEPAAYVKNTTPRIQVTFRRGEGGGGGKLTIQARPSPQAQPPVSKLGVAPRTDVTLSFDASGLSQPIEFTLDAPLPNEIGKTQLWWEWSALGDSGPDAIGDSTHTVYTTGGPLTDTWRWLGIPAPPGNTPSPVGQWTYLPIVEWTCEWAAGLSSPVDICDAIIANVKNTSMEYAVRAWHVGAMILAKGGYCGGWNKMFQAMAGCQGVAVHRRCFFLEWRVADDGDAMWCAVVIAKPGTGRKVPEEDASEFHDTELPLTPTSIVHDVEQQRYRFWSAPPQTEDGRQVEQLNYGGGHCINFLEHDGRLYLYDTCFNDRGVVVDMKLPPSDYQNEGYTDGPEVTEGGIRSISVSEQGDFKQQYLQNVMEHMMGCLRAGGRQYESVDSSVNGLTVPTRSIPTALPGEGLSLQGVADPRPITFFWGP